MVDTADTGQTLTDIGQTEQTFDEHRTDIGPSQQTGGQYMLYGHTPSQLLQLHRASQTCIAP